ncbi:hypothetical protein [Paenibacillus sp. HB172176]|uniref:hypothetical protein n=1 Tax=Paenibacillus sp. HB172176 TaxID=2493690 RepID=UPI00143A0147|nr:hypothetical protein [Paenibacillus sp. HB172176]
MEWHTRYQSQLADLYRRVELTIAGYPSPLNELGLEYASRFNPLQNDSRQDFICTLLPFWLKDAAALSEQQCQCLALANVYGMLYFFNQDDLMDSKWDSTMKQRSALGNLFYLDMLASFRELFASNSPFWSYFNRYVTEWADSVVNEVSGNYFLHDLLRTAGKASPVKLASTAAWLLASEPERIPVMEEGIDRVLVTLQMLDDWADWKEDWEEGNYNGLLALIEAEFGELTRESIGAAIYVRGCMKSFTAIAVHNHTKLTALTALLPELIAFNAYMIDALQSITETIESRKKARLQGGFNSLFSTFTSKDL